MSQARENIEHLITKGQLINLDSVRAEFAEGSEEMAFAIRYNENNSISMAERFMNVFPEGNGNGDDVSLESALEASAYVSPATVIVETPVDMDVFIELPAVEEISTMQQFGAEYEIEVFEADEIDLAYTIVNALYHGGVAGDNRDEIGMYQRENKSHSIFVDPSDLGEAVAIINALGFATDEDEIEEDNEEIIDFDIE